MSSTPDKPTRPVDDFAGSVVAITREVGSASDSTRVRLGHERHSTMAAEDVKMGGSAVNMTPAILLCITVSMHK